jgi:lipoprotein-anchoring transpeptidase ErfK/SrfK
MDVLKTDTDKRRLFEKNWFLILNLVLASVLGGMTLIIQWAAPPPVDTYQKARKAINLARKNQANIYAPDLLIDADYLLERAKLAWRQENTRWQINRNFYDAERLAANCRQKAEQAQQRSITIRDSLKMLSTTGIEAVRQNIDEFRPQFQTMPLDSRLRQKFVLGELNLMEAEAAFKRQDYKRAVARLKVAEGHIGRAGNEANETLNTYWSNAPRWSKWVQETIQWSKENNDVAIIIDKIDHECHVYSAGVKVDEFDIELGPNWLGYKLQRGDNATPEGQYRIRKKKAHPNTKYYLALEIDYPNQQDLARFYSAKARGDIAGNASVGGLIEIHGDGGKGANWTAGCVALTNQDMEKVFNVSKVGTPVTIVGSAKNARSPDFNKRANGQTSSRSQKIGD